MVHLLLLRLGIKALLVLIFLFAAPVQGQVLLYKRTIRSVDLGFGYTTRESVAGYLIVDVETGAAAEFDVDSKAKEFLGRSKIFTVYTVHGGSGKDYLVLSEAVADTDTYGPYTLSSTARGLSVLLDVGSVDKRSVPRTMRFVGRYVGRTGMEPSIDEQSGALVLDLPQTKSVNSTGKSFDEVVTGFRSDLTGKGFRDIHP
jgi:hypothetical protein